MSEMEQYNILIVDEDEATRCTLADLLRGRDEYRVLVAGEGSEAVRMFVEEARIDIVLTDIHMPGFNCLELMSDMQRLKHRPEILVMTSNGSAEVIEKARQIGARSVILKPFEHLDLIEAEVERAVQALFDSRATTSYRMMVPPSAARGVEAPVAAPSPELRPDPPAIAPAEEDIFVGNQTPLAGPGTSTAKPSAAARPIEVDKAAPIPASPLEAPDAGLTMRIDRPDFAFAPHPPEAPPEPEKNQPATPVVAGGESTKPAAVTTPAPAVEPGGGDKPRSPAADRMRGRVGLPNLGALKTKLFGKVADLSGGHLARGFPDLAPIGDTPPSPSVTAAGSTEAARPTSVKQDAAPPVPAQVEEASESEPFVIELEGDEEAVSTSATPVEEEKTPEPFVLELETAEQATPVLNPVEKTAGTKPIVPPVVIAAEPAPIVSPIESATDPDPAEAPSGEEGSGATTGTNGAEQEERFAGESITVEETVPGEQAIPAAGDADSEGSATVPAELETILAAGADVDVDKMAVQIPIICLQTWEEKAALEALRPMAGTMKRAFHTWSATRGIVKEDGTVMGEMYCDPMQALEFIRRQKANGLYVLIDFHGCLEDRKVVRMLREMFDGGETGRGMLVLTAPVISIPPELQPACQQFDWPRGGGIDFDQVLEEVRSELSTAGGDAIDLDPEARRLLIDRVQGMPAGRVRFEFLCALKGREQSG